MLRLIGWLLLAGAALAESPDFGSAVRPGDADLSQQATEALTRLRDREEPSRWRVIADRVPIAVAGKPAGFLYRRSVFRGEPTTGQADRVAVSLLETGLVPQIIAEHYRDTREDGMTVVRGIEIDSMVLRNTDHRAMARLRRVRELEFSEGKPQSLTGHEGSFVSLTPLDATVSLEGLEPVTGLPFDLEFLDPVESGGVPVHFVLVSGSEARPKLLETVPLDSKVGGLRSVDFQGGLGDEMRHYKRLAKGRPLYVFLTEEPDKNVAYMNSYVPVPKRKDWNYRGFRLERLDGTKVTLREPLPCVTFPQHLTDESPVELGSTMKHEVGHVIHELAGDIHNDGYDESFGSHTHELRTNSRSALVEGFAEFSAYKFRDTPTEDEPLPTQRLLSRTAPDAQKSLLAFYWSRIRERSKIKDRVKSADLDAFGASLHRDIFEGTGKPVRLAEIRERILKNLAGKGEPPLTEAAVEKELAAVEKKYASAVENLKDEEWTDEESHGLNRAFDDVVSSGTPGTGNDAAYQEANRRFDRMVQRTPTDLMLSEGFISVALLELDGELAKANIDFYSKVLVALKRDPYAGRSYPRQPVNFKELLAVLDRDAELRGKLFPVLERLTGGILKAEHFQLARRREADPLDRAKPGKRPAGGAAAHAHPVAGAGAEQTGSAGQAELTTGTRPPGPEVAPEFEGLPAR